MSAKATTLENLSRLIGAELRGEKDYKVSALATLEHAGSADISFISSDAYVKFLNESEAGAVVLKEAHAENFKGNALIVDDPYLAYAKLSAWFDPRPKREAGIHPSAVVAESASIGDNVSIGANCVIGDNVTIGENSEIYPGVVISENAKLGSNCLIYANVSIYSSVVIGDRVLIHSNTVIGSDGFGFAPSKEGWQKIHQLGTVRIGNDVEIGASTAIDRGALSDTVIHDGVIIDNQVHMAHNVEVGKRSAIAGCVGIAGSTTIGEGCTVAGMVAINGHISIADNSHFLGGTIVTKGNSEPGVYASTAPLQDAKSWRKSSARIKQLNELADRIKKLEKLCSE